MFKRFLLENGLTVLLRHDTENALFVDLSFIGGCALDELTEPELPHLLEHLVIKNPNMRDSLAAFGHVGAYTSPEELFFNIRPNSLRDTLEFLGELLRERQFSPQLIEVEQRVLKNERLAYLSNQENRVYEMSERLWFRGTSLGRKRSFHASRITKKMLEQYAQTIFSGTRGLLTISGNCRGLTDTIQKNFSFLSPGQPPAWRKQKRSFKGGVVVKRVPMGGVCFICMGFPGPGLHSKFSLEGSFLQKLATSWNNESFYSRLTSRGLSYGPTWGQEIYLGIGAQFFTAPIHPGTATEVVETFRSFIGDIANSLDKDLLEQVRGEVINELEAIISDPTELVPVVARRSLCRRRFISPLTDLERARKITSEDLTKFVRRFFSQDGGVVLLGNVGRLRGEEKLCERIF